MTSVAGASRASVPHLGGRHAPTGDSTPRGDEFEADADADMCPICLDADLEDGTRVPGRRLRWWLDQGYHVRPANGPLLCATMSGRAAENTPMPWDPSSLSTELKGLLNNAYEHIIAEGSAAAADDAHARATRAARASACPPASCGSSR